MGSNDQEGPDVLELLGVAARWVGPRGSRPARPSRRSPPRRRWRRASRCPSATTRARSMDFSGAPVRDLCGPRAGRRQLAGQQLDRHERRDGHVPGRRALGEHLLRPAGPRGGHVRRGQDGREARRRVEHRRPRRSAPTTTSRRSPSAPSRSARCRWPRRTRPSPPAASTATRSSSTRSPTAPAPRQAPPSANCARVISTEVAAAMNSLLSSGDDQRAPGSGWPPPTGGRRPARPAPSTATRPSGSPATPRRSPAPR